MSSLKTHIDYVKRGPCDELYTPDHAIKPLMPYLEKFSTFWEPTDHGESNITSQLLNAGKCVFCTHIDQEEDFLTTTTEADCIVTNPPYSLKDKFLDRAYELGIPFAFLLPTTALNGLKRGKTFRKHGAEILVLDKRIDFNGKGSVWFPVSWICWKVLPEKLIFAEVA